MAITPYPRGKCRLAVSRAKEATFGAGSTIDHYVDTPPVPLFVPTTQWLSNRELSTGVEGMTVQIPVSKSTGPYTMDIWPATTAMLWGTAFALGRDTMDVAGTNRTHAITMCGWDAFPGSFSIEQHLKGDTAVAATDLRLDGCVIDSFTLGGARDGLGTFGFTFSGSGQSAAAATFTGLTALVVSHDYYHNAKVRISIQAAAAEGDSSFADAPYSGTITAPSAAGTFANSASTVLSEAIESWSLTYTNPWEWTRAGGASAGAGAYGVQPVLTRARSAVFTTTLALSSSTEAYIKALLNSTPTNNAEYMVVVEGVTDVAVGTSYRSFCYVMPLAVLQTDPSDGGGGIDEAIKTTLTFEAKEDIINTYKLLYAFFENGSSVVFNQAP